MTEHEFDVAMRARGFESTGDQSVWWFFVGDRKFRVRPVCKGWFDRFQESQAARARLCAWYGVDR